MNGGPPPTAPSTRPAPTPPRRPASETYRSQAGHYDQRTDAFRQWRQLLVDRLPVTRGDTGGTGGTGGTAGTGGTGGTGLCLPLLQRKLGPAGAIVGIDASEEMLHIAAHRCSENNWDNVRLIAAPVDTAPLDTIADAALFCVVHDVMQSPTALLNIVDHLRPGAAVAAAGGKRPGPWMWPLRPWVQILHAPYITDFTGFDSPWNRLPTHIPDLQVHRPAAGVLTEQLPSALHQPGDDRAGQGRVGAARRAEHGPCARPWPRLIRPRPGRGSSADVDGDLRRVSARGWPARGRRYRGWSAVPDLRSGYAASSAPAASGPRDHPDTLTSASSLTDHCYIVYIRVWYTL
jgi:SAM-dependent methyltransferase